MERDSEINIRELAFIFRKHLKFILMVTLFITAFGFVLAKFIIPPTYESEATLIVNASSSDQTVTYSDVDLSQKLVDTYAIIMTSNTILDRVVKDLNLKEDTKALAKKISVQGEGTTEVLDLTVKDSNPERATAIANEIIHLAPNEIIRTVKAGSVEIISPAQTNHTPVSPNVRLFTAVAAVGGVWIAFMIAFASEMMNDKFKSEEDVQKKLGFTVIAVIPNAEKLSDKRSYGA